MDDKLNILVGRKAIAKFVQIGWSRIKKWIENDGFPAFKIMDGKTSKYIANPDHIKQWWSKHNLKNDS